MVSQSNIGWTMLSDVLISEGEQDGTYILTTINIIVSLHTKFPIFYGVETVRNEEKFWTIFVYGISDANKNMVDACYYLTKREHER